MAKQGARQLNNYQQLKNRGSNKQNIFTCIKRINKKLKIYFYLFILKPILPEFGTNSLLLVFINSTVNPALASSSFKDEISSTHLKTSGSNNDLYNGAFHVKVS